ncbi:hypothetical protein [Hydrocoleum sp. CS-953]|uniref:hypothetical protein n=1 Tax=Hydrocoleum sp. CS-953 TaxID=1671698 RepID=UPI00352A41B3
MLERSGEYRIDFLRQQFQDAMSEHCGVFRSQDVMQQGLEKLEQLQEQYQQVYLDDKGKSWNTEIIEALELRSIIVVGETILSSALSRQESRGAHSREDFPQRNDEQFLQHSLAYYSLAGIDINYRPVAITMFEPQERKY